MDNVRKRARVDADFWEDHLSFLADQAQTMLTESQKIAFRAEANAKVHREENKKVQDAIDKTAASWRAHSELIAKASSKTKKLKRHMED